MFLYAKTKQEGRQDKKYMVRLTESEREELRKLVSTGKRSAQLTRRARILFFADQGDFGPARADEQVGELLDVSTRSVERVRRQLVEEGLTAALERKSDPSLRIRMIDGDLEAHLTALSCSEPPEGFKRWTLRLLADKAVELKFVESISHEAVRQALKKGNKALAETSVVHTTRGECRLCLCYGGRP
ncbi:MAG: hypothetical protein ACI8W8_003040 [Rhodothermales bacterium]